MSDAITTQTQPIPTVHARYRHYKGGEYMVLAVASHTETKEFMVVYSSVQFGSIWVRPLSIWNQFVNVEADSGRLVPRFVRI